MNYNGIFQQRQEKKLILSGFFFLMVFILLPSSGFTVETTSLKSTTAVILAKEAKVSEKVFGLRGISNVGRVSPGIYRGAQPLPAGYATLKEMEIKTVINLRSRHSEKDKVEASGMKSIEVPFNVLEDVKFEGIMRDTSHIVTSSF